MKKKIIKRKYRKNKFFIQKLKNDKTKKRTNINKFIKVIKLIILLI